VRARITEKAGLFLSAPLQRKEKGKRASPVRGKGLWGYSRGDYYLKRGLYIAKKKFLFLPGGKRLEGSGGQPPPDFSHKGRKDSRGVASKENVVSGQQEQKNCQKKTSPKGPGTKKFSRRGTASTRRNLDPLFSGKTQGGLYNSLRGAFPQIKTVGKWKESLSGRVSWGGWLIKKDHRLKGRQLLKGGAPSLSLREERYPSRKNAEEEKELLPGGGTHSFCREGPL